MIEGTSKYSGAKKTEDTEEDKFERKNFSELIKFTFAGYFIGLGLGALLDYLGFQLSALGGWLVRTFAGEGESIFEGFYAIRQRLRRTSSSMAEAYAWGKLIGLFVPGLIDLTSRISGVDILAIEGFYIPFFYSNSDQIGANISSLIYFYRREKRWSTTLGKYVSHPVMLTSLLIVVLVPFGLLTARLLGFSPVTQVYAAIETIAANICWLPPLVGWLARQKRFVR
ncbi:MAG: hypothetical protein QXH42_10065 [Thermoplasmata archaeon]